MRLINAKTLKLEEFLDNAVPPYAILSHTWETDEVIFKDVTESLWDAQGKRGFCKIQNCCKQTVKDGLGYAWCDTCCIDKSSSAELTEAINSMYRYYQECEICYAYLADVTFEYDKFLSSFARSRWFTRGWTLQELLAPPTLIFFDQNWRSFGTKVSLAEKMVPITQIPSEVLTMTMKPRQYSIAQRMSWAATRSCSRVEDVAYSLLGIFNINLPLLYGEGERAFERLQQEIIKSSADHSIFAWETRHSRVSFSDSSPSNFAFTNYEGTSYIICDLLAPSPAYFASSADVVFGTFAEPGVIFGSSEVDDYKPTPYSMTNMGLEIEVLLTPWTSKDLYFMTLWCQSQSSGERRRYGIFLLKNKKSDTYIRVHPKKNSIDEMEFKSGKVVVTKKTILITSRAADWTTRPDSGSVDNRLEGHPGRLLFIAPLHPITGTVYSSYIQSDDHRPFRTPLNLSQINFLTVPTKKSSYTEIEFKIRNGSRLKLLLGYKSTDLWYLIRPPQGRLAKLFSIIAEENVYRTVLRIPSARRLDPLIEDVSVNLVDLSRFSTHKFHYECRSFLMRKAIRAFSPSHHLGLSFSLSKCLREGVEFYMLEPTITSA